MTDHHRPAALVSTVARLLYPPYMEDRAAVKAYSEADRFCKAVIVRAKARKEKEKNQK
jgi:hypothetical protein